MPPQKPKSKPKKVAEITSKWRTWAERVQIFDDVVSSLEFIVNGDEVCLISDVFGDAIQVGKSIGAGEYGEAYQAVLFGKDYKLAIKKVELSAADQGKSYTQRQLSSGNSAWAELAAYMLGSILVMARICNNLPFTYKYTLCKNCHFNSSKVRGNRNKPCILVVNEFAEGDLHHYLKQPRRWSLPLIHNCVFQIAAGLYSMEKYFRGMTHNDLHYGNVLVHEVKPGGYWEYKIDGKRYYVPNLGYVFVLWDFGMIHVPGRIIGRPLKDNETDIGQITSLIADSLKSIMRGKNSVAQELVDLEGLISLKDILGTMFNNYLKKPSGLLIDQFNMDTSIESLKAAVPTTLQPFLTSPKVFRTYSRSR